MTQAPILSFGKTLVAARIGALTNSDAADAV